MIKQIMSYSKREVWSYVREIVHSPESYYHPDELIEDPFKFDLLDEILYRIAWQVAEEGAESHEWEWGWDLNKM